MAKKITTVEEVETLPPEPAALASDPEEAPEDIEVRELLDSLGSDESATVHIYRQGTGGPRDLTLLARLAPAEFDPIMLAGEPYNGGTFRIHVRSRGGIAGNRMLKVAPNAKIGGASPVASSDRLAEVMMQGFTRLGELIAAQGARAQTDPLASVQGIVGLVKQLMPAASAGGDMNSTLGQMKTMLEFSRLLNPPREGKVLSDDGEVNPNALLMKGLEVFGDAVRTRKGAEAESPPPAALPSAVQVPGGAAVFAASHNDQAEGDDVAFFKLQVRLAVRSAKAGEDPEEFADSIYKLIPDDVLRQMAESPDWFKVILEAAPDAAPFQAWFDKVRAALVSFAREDGILTPPEPGPIVAPVTPPAGEQKADSGDHTGAGTTQ